MAAIDTMDPAQEYLETMLSRHKKMDDLTERGDSAVQQFYQDAVVFVTGATGFLGKQLIEKLIRSTKLSKVYVVLRPKKGNSVEERLSELLKEPVFDKLRIQQPAFAEKIVPVAGDVGELNLGISYQEWNIMADEVNVIFHLAAATRFDASIRESTLINIRGTKEALRFGKQCKNLNLIENWPNTYCFTKAIAEEAVRALSGDLPICVVKPSIGLGLMHTSMTNGKVHLGLIPVDYVNNTIIVAAWETAKQKSTKDKKPKVYTVVSTTRSPKKWSDLSKLLKELTVWKYPTPMSMGYSLYLQTRIPFLYWVYSWLFHMIPAYIADGVCSVLGRQKRFVKLYTKMTRLMVALSYFTLNDWHFADNNTEALYDNLSAADKEIFSFDIDRLNWTEFMSSFVIGVRQYILKDGLVNTKVKNKLLSPE
ncbi:unnamed protein product [Spodoptera littoralis]|uniref:Fatty acyl-CoA reductase n=1 Tax=Spodoptera littoralis TaxID=7109 RepID=A0A9P0N753_SPOLI|nr:unnamed protein product [Spodoptera littoralis]CAH1643969.1 unnamed protein product [Spodoptera littoralis]